MPPRGATTVKRVDGNQIQDSRRVSFVKLVNINLLLRKPLHVFYATLVNTKIVKAKPVAKAWPDPPFSRSAIHSSKAFLVGFALREYS